ncbi:hypothetical protein [Vibrio sp. 10N]|uniref:hypothetical protein n=1 Tax=Vibrio sp. 10N TaxID=3058938 RepID=UPI0028138804|nr:hypothetical protein VB10N_41540 [Vibrio sp. 10N]
MTKNQLLSQLFLRESHTKKLALPTQESLDTVDPIMFQEWQNSKREFVPIDVANTHWIKTCTEGYITEVVFHADGTLNEYRLFDRFETQGTWLLADGILHVEIIKGDNRYSFGVVGNADVNIHSAIEHKNDELHSYLKLAQIKPN